MKFNQVSEGLFKNLAAAGLTGLAAATSFTPKIAEAKPQRNGGI